MIILSQPLSIIFTASSKEVIPPPAVIGIDFFDLISLFQIDYQSHYQINSTTLIYTVLKKTNSIGCQKFTSKMKRK